MNRTIQTHGLLAATIAGFFSAGASAQQSCQNDAQQIRTELQRSQIGAQPRQQVEDLLSRAAGAGAETCNALITAAQQRLSEAQASSSQQSARAGEQQTQPGQLVQEPERQSGDQQAQAREGASDLTTDVQIEQPAADVNVDAGAPDVQIQQRPPQVTVEQQSPEVTITQPEPEVTVRQAEPQVTVTQGEPQVQVRQAEPEVRVRQGGEPDVRVLESEDEAQAGVAGERARQGQPGEQGEQGEQGLQAQQGEQQRPAAALDETEASQLVGSSIKTAEGEELGEVEAVARSRSGSDLYAIADVGGFFGIGERTVAVPLERADVDREGNLITRMSREELEQLREYDAQQFAPVG